MSYIKDKVIVVTGASGGIGKATAEHLAKEGAKVVLAARNEKELHGIVQEIEGNGGVASFKATDISSRDEVSALIDFTVENYA